MPVEAPLYKIFGYLAPAILGAFVSLRFLPEGSSTLNKLISYASGVAIANYWGYGLSEYLLLDGLVETGIVFTFGIFGLTVASNIWVEMPTVFKVVKKKLGLHSD